MLEDKINELLSYGNDIETITNIVLYYYNLNPFCMWNFKPLSYIEMKELVISIILKNN